MKLDNTAFIDGYIDSTHVMIEQKSIGKDLRKGIKQKEKEIFLRPFVSSDDYINNKKRYCLLLVNCLPKELHSMP